MNRRLQIIERLTELTNDHPDDCRGCDKCPEINGLREKLLHNPKVDRILAKGEEMTRDEIKFLLGKGVHVKVIAKALGINRGVCSELLQNWGMIIKGERTVTKLKDFTVEEYKDLKARLISDQDIAKEKGVSMPTLRTWKQKTIETPSAPNIKTPEVPKIKTPEAPKIENTVPELVDKSTFNSLKRALEVREKAIEDLKLKLEGSITKEELDKLRNGWDEELIKEQDKTLEERAKRTAMEKEYHRTQTTLINVDAELENTRDQLHQAREEAVKNGQEVELLRGLVRLYMPF